MPLWTLGGSALPMKSIVIALGVGYYYLLSRERRLAIRRKRLGSLSRSDILQPHAAIHYDSDFYSKCLIRSL